MVTVALPAALNVQTALAPAFTHLVALDLPGVGAAGTFVQVSYCRVPHTLAHATCTYTARGTRHSDPMLHLRIAASCRHYDGDSVGFEQGVRGTSRGFEARTYVYSRHTKGSGVIAHGKLVALEPQYFVTKEADAQALVPAPKGPLQYPNQPVLQVQTPPTLTIALPQYLSTPSTYLVLHSYVPPEAGRRDKASSRSTEEMQMRRGVIAMWLL